MNYKKQAFYNTVGNLVYMCSLWLISSVLTVRISGFEAAGVFSLAMSVGNIFYYIAVYGMRSFQASDATYQYSPKDYIVVRGITIAAAAVSLAVYLVTTDYSSYFRLAIVLYTLYKFLEAYSDVFFGELQRVGHLEICGVSMSLKGFLSVVVFSVVLKQSDNLNYALLAMVITAGLFLIVYDWRGYKKYRNMQVAQSCTSIVGLLKAGFSMLLTTVFPIVVTAIPRIALEDCYGTEILGIYSSIATPTVLITTLVPNILAPFMTLFGMCYHEREYSKLIKMLLVALGLTALLGGAACVCAYFLGDWVMSLLFGEEILPYMYLLIPLVVATTVYALSMAANSVLISIRQPLWLTLCSAMALVTSLVLSRKLVQSMGIMGTVWAFGVPFFVQLAFQIGYLVYKLCFDLPYRAYKAEEEINRGG